VSPVISLNLIPSATHFSKFLTFPDPVRVLNSGKWSPRNLWQEFQFATSSAPVNNIPRLCTATNLIDGMNYNSTKKAILLKYPRISRWMHFSFIKLIFSFVENLTVTSIYATNAIVGV